MSVAGTYDTVVKSPMGDQKGTFTVVPGDDGNTFTGSMAGGMGSMDVKDGTIAGDTLKWKMDMTVPMPMTLDCEATVNGDQMTGKVNAGAFGDMALTGEPAGQPMKMGISISDLTCGLYSVIGIQAALAMRERTGRGQHVDMALLDCSVGLLASQATHFFTTGENPPRMGNEHAQVSAYGVFPVADGKVVLAPANDGLFRRLLALLGRGDLLGDERFATNESRLANRAELDAMIAAETGKWQLAELLSACGEAGIPAGPINPIDAVFADPQVRERGMRIELDGIAGVRSPFTFSGAQLALDHPSPRKGEHG